jgi:hypothetical protein
MNEKYKELEDKHLRLRENYEKLECAIDLLTCDEGRSISRLLRKGLETMQGKNTVKVK